ncbi:MAG: M64 family metallopeptidase [Proteobacteria bacterium]|nr:M64 family metallopeptidase [Pseudomonadota bacterium]
MLATPGSARTEVFVAEYIDDGQSHRQVVARRMEWRAWKDGPDKVSESSYPRIVAEHEEAGHERIVRLASPSRAALELALLDRQVSQVQAAAINASMDEVHTLVSSGPPENRIDVVFMGDGYTQEERDKFLSDMDQMVGEMFEDVTFRSYLPVFNIHAVFRPSTESGIGRGRAKNTAFGLYRPGNTLRAIYTSKAQAARDACAQAPDCDYPVLIANDPYYGGLGGEFAISTSSPTSGTVVLRHELGHNFGNVGEEYDGGGSYFGANYSSSLSVKWLHWLTDGAPVQAESGASRAQDWPWYNLQGGPYRVTFNSSNGYTTGAIRLSASGLEEVDAMSITLDGEPLPFSSAGNADRNFYDLDITDGFGPGSHELVFTETVADGDNWLSSFQVLEFGPDYKFDPDYIGAYPVSNREGGVIGYRSNHATCLMRNMKSDVFCSVCQENNWPQFFERIRLIDDLQATEEDGQVRIALSTLALGQFRQSPVDVVTQLDIRWSHDGVQVPAFDGLASFFLPAADARGTWEARVDFITPEVRESQGLLSDSMSITVTPTFWRDDFENGASGWTASGLWHLVADSQCGNPGYSSPTHAYYYGQDSSCSYDTGSRTSGELISPVIVNIPPSSSFSFRYYRNVESYSGSYDRTIVEVVTGSGTTEVFSLDSRDTSASGWQDSGAISLASFAGQDIQLRFYFDSVDAVSNDFTGWLIDDIAVH